MKRYISIILLLFLCALMLPGCKEPTASTPDSTPQAALPPTTPTTNPPTVPIDPNPLVTVYLLTGYTADGSGESKETAFVYDEAGKLLEISLDSEVVVAYTYDVQGNCLSYQNTLQGIDQTYDAQGNILTDRTEGEIITNTYDEAGRCIQIERHSTDGTLLSVLRYTYGDRGNLLSEVLEQDGSIRYEILHTYDEEGRQLTETYCRDGVISPEGPSYVWQYGAECHLESEYIYYGEEFSQGTLFLYSAISDEILAYMRWSSDGSMYQYSHFFDKAGNLTKYYETFTDADKNRYVGTYEYEYDSHGNTVMHKYVDYTGEEQAYRWTYDESGVVMTGYSFTSPTQSYEYAWFFDEKGNKVQEIKAGDTPHEITWEYDRQGRVLSVTCTGSIAYEENYVYDEHGNLLQYSHTADSVTTVTSYTYTAITVTPEVAAQMRAQQEEIFQRLNEEVTGME